MSLIETETVVSSGSTPDEPDKKSPRIDSTELTKTGDEIRRRRYCRRHSYAFRCSQEEIDEQGDEGKHYQSVLLVRVIIPPRSSRAKQLTISWIYCWLEWRLE